MTILKKKISEISKVATSLSGIVTIGVDANNEDIQIPLQLFYDALLEAQSAAIAAIESIAPTASAPTPVIPTGTTKTYEFSTGGECAWITGGAVTVEVGDMVSAAFTEPNTWVYTYQNVLKRKANASVIGDIDTILDILNGDLEADVQEIIDNMSGV